MAKIAILLLLVSSAAIVISQVTHEAANWYLRSISSRMNKAMNRRMLRRWIYETDVNPPTERAMVDGEAGFLRYQRQVFNELKSLFDDASIANITKEMKKEFKFLKIIGYAALSDEEQTEISSRLGRMESTYATAKICPYTGSPFPAPGCTPTLTLDELSARMAKSTDYDELKYMWLQWREKAGKPIKEDYAELVILSNRAANAQGYADTASLWNEYYLYKSYDETRFRNEIVSLWDEVRPLYQELYTYVRRALSEGPYAGKIDPKEPMPAHIFGNMWAESWVNIADHVMPFKDLPKVDVTDEMVAQNWTTKQMFTTAEKFFTDLGFRNMTDIFWERSVFTRPEDKEVQCHPRAENFFSPGDFRIAMCAQVNQEDFITIHRKLSNIVYFMQYDRLRNVFKSGANPGFQGAIGGAVSLAVSTPKHMRKLGLMKQREVSPSTPRYNGLATLPDGVVDEDMNYLLRMALDKVAFLPHTAALESWRWDVFDGAIEDDEYNTAWWNRVFEFQGLEHPDTPKADDFDPGAKYQIAANVEYVRQFVSTILQFQFYEGMCATSGHKGPLHQCDFDGNKTAGAKLRNIMEVGMTTPWNEILSEITADGKGDMSASSLLKYFEPLYKYLKKVNEPYAD